MLGVRCFISAITARPGRAKRAREILRRVARPRRARAGPARSAPGVAASPAWPRRPGGPGDLLSCSEVTPGRLSPSAGGPRPRARSRSPRAATPRPSFQSVAPGRPRAAPRPRSAARRRAAGPSRRRAPRARCARSPRGRRRASTSTGAAARPSSDGSSSYSLRWPSISITWRRRADRQLVHAVARVEHDRALDAQPAPAPRPSCPPAIRRPRRAPGTSRRPGCTAGPSTLNTVRSAKLAPRHAGEPKRRVEDRREQEADAGLVDAARHAFGAEVDLHAELLEHVGRAAHRRRGAVAVLGDPRAAGGGDDRGRGSRC